MCRVRGRGAWILCARDCVGYRDCVSVSGCAEPFILLLTPCVHPFARTDHQMLGVYTMLEAFLPAGSMEKEEVDKITVCTHVVLRHIYNVPM